MILPTNFTYSQQNLQDYLDCRYRFLLKYLKGVEWPAVESEPVLLQEARMELGQSFHRLVQQYFSGIDPSILSDSIQSTELAEWWHAFLDLDLLCLPGEKTAEKTISIPFLDYRLLAKYDLLIKNGEGTYTIFDWKTSTSLPSRHVLAKRLQTIIYPLVLQKSIIHVEGQLPVTIEMIYWYPAQPSETIRFQFSSEQQYQGEVLLTRMTEEIIQNDEDWFLRTADQKKCYYCRYRSLCDRGIGAGTLDPGTENFFDENVFDLDFDSI